MIYYVAIFLNYHVSKLGTSNIYLPRELVLRQKLDWIKHCTSTNKSDVLEFDEYVRLMMTLT